MIEWGSNFFSSSFGIFILGCIAILGFLALFKKLTVRLLQRFLGPFFRSIVKEPQRLVSMVKFDLKNIDKEGIPIVGEIFRSNSSPILYPTVTIACNIFPRKRQKINISPLINRVVTYHIYHLRYDDIDKIDGKATIKPIVKCSDDLVMAKVNKFNFEMLTEIESLRKRALDELREKLIRGLRSKVTTKDTLEDMRQKFIDEVTISDDELPRDVFRFLVFVRELEEIKKNKT